MSDIKIISLENLSQNDLKRLELIFVSVWPVCSDPNWMKKLEEDRRIVEAATKIAEKIGCSMVVVSPHNIKEIQLALANVDYMTNSVTMNFYRKK